MSGSLKRSIESDKPASPRKSLLASFSDVASEGAERPKPGLPPPPANAFEDTLVDEAPCPFKPDDAEAEGSQEADATDHVSVQLNSLLDEYLSDSDPDDISPTCLKWLLLDGDDAVFCAATGLHQHSGLAHVCPLAMSGRPLHARHQYQRGGNMTASCGAIGFASIICVYVHAQRRMMSPRSRRHPQRPSNVRKMLEWPLMNLLPPQSRALPPSPCLQLQPVRARARSFPRQVFQSTLSVVACAFANIDDQAISAAMEAKYEALLRRLCEKKRKKPLRVPENIRKLWLEGGKTRRDLKKVLIECNGNEACAETCFNRPWKPGEPYVRACCRKPSRSACPIATAKRGPTSSKRRVATIQMP